MSSDAALAFIVAPIIAGVFSILAAFVAERSRRQAKAAHEQASQAAENTSPGGDGFADEVRAGLADILAVATDARDAATRAEANAEKARDLIDAHLQAHADAQIYELKPARAARGD